MALDKICSACGSRDQVDIETVTNVHPKRDEMFPVLLCIKCKGHLAKGQLDVQLNSQGNLDFVIKKK